MYRSDKITEADKVQFYKELNQILIALIGDEPSWLANLANAAGLLFDQMEDINWAGFYILHDNFLVLGPFQGKPACTRIPVGKGVCGTAAAMAKTILVPDVHQFPGHIACDACSRSEIVLPFFVDGILTGVLDIDSPVYNRFDAADVRGLEEFIALLQNNLHRIRG